MKERGILFSAPMVRANLAGTKTQTRRAVKGMALEWLRPDGFTPDFVASAENNLCPYGVPGDRLWVRETFVQGWPHTSDGVPDQFDEDDNEKPKKTWYRATSPDLQWSDDGENMGSPKWKPSIFMPRVASRLTLEVTQVRIERLQDISEADAKAEGCEPCLSTLIAGLHRPTEPGFEYRLGYARLWDQINRADSAIGWAANPWVWAVSFRVLPNGGVSPLLPAGGA